MFNMCKRVEDFFYKILLCGKKSVMLYLFVYKITFGLVYIIVISNFFTYVGYKLQISIFRSIISLILCVLLFSDSYKLLISKKRKFSYVLLFLLDIGYAVPMITLYEFGGMSTESFIFFTVYWIFLHLWLKVFSFIEFKKRKKLKIKKVTIIFGIIIILFLGLFISYNSNMSGINLSLNHVYEIRTKFKERDFSSLFNYLYSILGSLTPVCITICLYHKKYFLAMMFTYIQINLYSMAAIKKYLFFLVLAWLVYYIFSKEKYRYLMLPILSISNLVAIMNYKMSYGMPQIANYLQRRTFLMPVRLYTYYFDFFSKHEPDFFSQSFLRHFGISSQYDMPIANIIGGLYEYQKSFETTASNGLCGDAMANMGWCGGVAYPFILALVLTMFNYVTKEIDFCIIMIVSFIFFIYLTNGSLFSNLLSNGFVVIWLILRIYSSIAGKQCNKVDVYME